MSAEFASEPCSHNKLKACLAGWKLKLEVVTEMKNKVFCTKAYQPLAISTNFFSAASLSTPLFLSG